METETYVFKVNNFYDLKSNSWSGALQTLDAIEEKGLEDEFIEIINNFLSSNIYDDNMCTETQLNDYIWFETKDIEEQLGCKLWEE